MSKPSFGVDISYHKGNIDFTRLARNVEFVIIRAGYGQGNIDKKLHEYTEGCIANEIPYGFFWFSYASTPALAWREAEFFVDAIAKYKPALPVFFDYEEGSRLGKKVPWKEISDMAVSFLNKMSLHGYNCGIYCDNEHYEGYAKAFEKSVPIWYARYSNGLKVYDTHSLWQYSETGMVDGINGHVDLNYCYMDFKGKGNNETNDEIDEKKMTKLIETSNRNLTTYIGVAKDILAGKYGNGDERKNNLKLAGFDYRFAQNIVNILLE